MDNARRIDGGPVVEGEEPLVLLDDEHKPEYTATDKYLNKCGQEQTRHHNYETHVQSDPKADLTVRLTLYRSLQPAALIAGRYQGHGGIILEHSRCCLSQG